MSVFFYAWGEPVYIVLMILSILLNYFCGLDIYRRRLNSGAAKNSLIVAIVINLVVLSFFKYYEFLITTINGVFSADIAIRNLPLPIGISFYTFQAISYLVDIYRKDVVAQRNIVKFGVYIAMFPSLLAGPIVRYLDIEEQLSQRQITWDKFGNGLMLFIIGLGKKVIVAGSAAIVFAQIMSMDLGGFSAFTAWVGVFAFAFKIYFDFSGYSDMAIGLAKMFGFDLLPNFNYPYTATSIADFWRRWHISLSTWVRDYLYIPLGGSRVNISRNVMNLILVWALIGLWHGATWHFVFFGIYFGAIIALEKHVWGKFIKKLPRVIGQIYTMFLVMIGWVFFFSPNLSFVIGYIQTMFGIGVSGILDTQGLFLLTSNWLMVIIMVLGSGTLGVRLLRFIINAFTNALLKKLVASFIYLGIFVLSLAFILNYGSQTFIYFSF
jgi:alginate O-acetyltransferase complex protein AlgI